jgi:hypothetical protein
MYIHLNTYLEAYREVMFSFGEDMTDTYKKDMERKKNENIQKVKMHIFIQISLY